MNWLAHVLLSDRATDTQVGNLIADTFKGKSWDGASSSLVRGLEQHKAIDKYTDSHDTYFKSKAQLSQQGHLRGIVIDIVYDFILAKHWSKFCLLPIDEFITHFYSSIDKATIDYPQNVSHFLNKVIETDLLRQYQHTDNLCFTLQRIDKRLSARMAERELASNYLSQIHQVFEHLEQNFLVFFPQLQKHIKTQYSTFDFSHWKTCKH